jgi:phosphomannomutase
MIDKKSIEHIFRAYDIRGIYGKDIDEEIFEAIGETFASFVNEKEIVVGRDCRNSSPGLTEAFIHGINSCGKYVINIGTIPRGVALFYGILSEYKSAYISASHLSSEWNGIKFAESDGRGFNEENKKIKEIFMKRDFSECRTHNSLEGNFFKDAREEYINYLLKKVERPERKINVLLDCGNGTAGLVAPKLFRLAGFDVDTLFENSDGNFPNRIPEPKEKFLSEAKKKAKDYDITFAYDCDVDRVSAIDNKCEFIEPEKFACFLLEDIVKNHEGPVVASLECSKIIEEFTKKFSRQVIYSKVGYTNIIQGIHENNACLGFEKSAHFCIPSIVPFDDAIAVSFYAAVALSKRAQSLGEILKDILRYENETIDFECSDETKSKVMETMIEKLTKLKDYKKIITIDGIRVDYGHEWILLRQSNTSPLIRLTLESDSRENFLKLREKFSRFLENEIKNQM